MRKIAIKGLTESAEKLFGTEFTMVWEVYKSFSIWTPTPTIVKAYDAAKAVYTEVKIEVIDEEN